MQCAEELRHRRPLEIHVVCQQAVPEPDGIPPGVDHDRPDGRNAAVLVRHALHRGAAPTRISPADDWLHHEPGFVDEDDVGASRYRFFQDTGEPPPDPPLDRGIVAVYVLKLYLA